MNSMKTELTVGVIGGMGPYATLAFFQSVLDHTPAQKDWEHLHIVIDNNPKIPSRTRAFLYGEADPVPMMVESADRLRAAGADFVVLPCNSAHFFLKRVRQLTTAPFIDMIEATSQAVLAAGCKVVGVLGGEVTVKGELYEAQLIPMGVDVLQVSDQEQELVRNVIEDAKQNIISGRTHAMLQGLIGLLKERGADGVILGCTEFPLVMPGVTSDCTIIDSMDVLASEVVRRAKAGGEPVAMPVQEKEA
jgi:aspartate racemase